LGVLAIYDVLLPVEEPRRDFVLEGVLHNRDDPLKLVGIKVASALFEIDICLFAKNIGISSSNTLDFSQRVHDFAFAINVGVEKTKNVLELCSLLRNYKRHAGCFEKCKATSDSSAARC